MDEVLYWVCTKRAPCLMTYDKQTQNNFSQACLASKSDSAINCDNVPVTPKKKNKRKLTILDEDSATSDKPNNLYFEVPKNTEEHPLLTNANTNVHTLCVKKGKPSSATKRQKLQNGTEKRAKKNALATSTPKQSKPPQIRRSPRVAKNKSKISDMPNNLDESNLNTNKAYVESNLALRPRKLNIYKEGGDQTIMHVKPKHKRSELQPTHVEDDDVSDVSGFTANYIRSTKVDPKKCDKKKLMTAAWRKVDKSNEQVIISYNKSINAPHHKNGTKDEQSLSSFNVVNVITLPRASKSAMMMKPMKSPPCLKAVGKEVSHLAEHKCKRVTEQSPDKQVSPYSESSKRPVKFNNTCTTTQHRCHCKIPLPQGQNSSSINIVNVPKEWNASTEVGVRTRSKGGLALQRKTPVETSSNSSADSAGVVFNITSRKTKNTQTCDKKTPQRKTEGACLRKHNPEHCCTCVSVKTPRKTCNKKSVKDKIQVPSCSKCINKRVNTKKIPNFSSSPSLTGDDDKKSMEKSSSLAFCIHIDNKGPGRKCCLPSGTYVNRESPERKKQGQSASSVNRTIQEQLVYVSSRGASPVKNCTEEKSCVCGPDKCDCIQQNTLPPQPSCTACMQDKGLSKTPTHTRRRSSLKKRLSNKRESLRNKSGFTACFSDSGCSDCEEHHHSKKYFC